MRTFYMIGSALFIGLTALQFKTPNNEVFMGLFAFSAVLGFFGEMGNKKLLFPLLGFGANAYFLANILLNAELDATILQLIGLGLNLVWMVVIFINWQKQEVKFY